MPTTSTAHELQDAAVCAWKNGDLELARVEMCEMKETIEMLSSTCMDLQGTVQRQTKQLQKQRKQLTDAREQMIALQKYADAKAENEVRPDLRESLAHNAGAHDGEEPPHMGSGDMVELGPEWSAVLHALVYGI